MRDFRIKSLHVAVFVAAVLLLPSLALASTSVGNNVSVGGTLGVTGISTLAGITHVTGATYVTGTLQSTGAVTTYGNVTLGDAATDLNTLTGYFNTMKVGDLTATSTLGSNTLAVGAVAADVLGKFYVNASGNVSASGTLAVFGATTLNGAVTLGDAVTDSITITGKLGTINVSDNTTTSSLANNSFNIAQTQTDRMGKFYVDSSGNVSASGTLAVFGAVSINGTVALGDAASDRQTLTGYFNVMRVGDLTSTSTLTQDTLAVGAIEADVLGKFYVNASGNVSASGTLAVFGATTLNGAVTLGDAVTDSITITGKLGTINVSDNTTTSSLANNSFNIAQTQTDRMGKFYVDSSGNVNVSGTLRLPSQSNGSTSTIWVGGLGGAIGQICFGDSDGVGATCIAFQDGSATIDVFATSTY